MGVGTDLLEFTLQLRKTSENLSLETDDEGCAAIVSNGVPYPPNYVGKNAQHVRKEGKGLIKISVGKGESESKFLYLPNGTCTTVALS